MTRASAASRGGSEPGLYGDPGSPMPARRRMIASCLRDCSVLILTSGDQINGLGKIGNSPVWPVAWQVSELEVADLAGDVGVGVDLVPLGQRVPPQPLQHFAQVLAHSQRDVRVDPVHALQGMASAVHLDHLARVRGVQPAADGRGGDVGRSAGRLAGGSACAFPARRAASWRLARQRLPGACDHRRQL
jgi:hypothetical protein